MSKREFLIWHYLKFRFPIWHWKIFFSLFASRYKFVSLFSTTVHYVSPYRWFAYVGPNCPQSICKHGKGKKEVTSPDNGGGVCWCAGRGTRAWSSSPSSTTAHASCLNARACLCILLEKELVSCKIWYIEFLSRTDL
jgi:hypothetical protein